MVAEEMGLAEELEALLAEKANAPKSKFFVEEDSQGEQEPQAEATESSESAGSGEVAESSESSETAATKPVAEKEPEVYREFKRELRRKPGKWYVIHSYAGYERKVKENLWSRRETMGVVNDIYEIQVPMEDVMEIKNGQRKMVSRVRIPGYVLVRMNLTEDTWSIVRHTPGVTGFVGNPYNPAPLRLGEVFDMLKTTINVVPEEGESSEGGPNKEQPIEIDFKVGDTITIKSGSFEGLPGTISEINIPSGKLTVLVSLFERETPVELAFDQVAQMS